jgi:NAD+--dinitrogen-reductase ADP-D-ribosyltransferase
VTPCLPNQARLPINRCNLPASILGGPTFQRHPAPLLIDGVAELHRELFDELAAIANPHERAGAFMNYMDCHFSLSRPEEAGWQAGARQKRNRADYLRMLRGWLFDPDNREGAVLKGWVESRFGLLTRHHRVAIDSADSSSYRAFMEERMEGLYNTNGLESQLDLLYSYCQHELAIRHNGIAHLTLYRGVNRLAEHDTLARGAGHSHTLLLNNLNSFSSSRERADEFGDQILAAEIPTSKIFFYNNLLPGVLKGEEEYLVIGGVYLVTLSQI